MKNIQKLISEDLKKLMKEKNVSEYTIHRKEGICSQPTLAKILRGDESNKLNIKVIFDIYKFLGEDKIVLRSDSVFVEIRF